MSKRNSKEEWRSLKEQNGMIKSQPIKSIDTTVSKQSRSIEEVESSTRSFRASSSPSPLMPSLKLTYHKLYFVPDDDDDDDDVELRDVKSDRVDQMVGDLILLKMMNQFIKIFDSTKFMNHNVGFNDNSNNFKELLIIPNSKNLERKSNYHLNKNPKMFMHPKISASPPLIKQTKMSFKLPDYSLEQCDRFTHEIQQQSSNLRERIIQIQERFRQEQNEHHKNFMKQLDRLDREFQEKLRKRFPKLPKQ